MIRINTRLCWRWPWLETKARGISGCQRERREGGGTISGKHNGTCADGGGGSWRELVVSVILGRRWEREGRREKRGERKLLGLRLAIMAVIYWLALSIWFTGFPWISYSLIAYVAKLENDGIPGCYSYWQKAEHIECSHMESKVSRSQHPMQQEKIHLGFLYQSRCNATCLKENVEIIFKITLISKSNTQRESVRATVLKIAWEGEHLQCPFIYRQK